MDNSIKCSVCDTEFTQKKNLYAHLRKIHEIEPLSLKSQNFSCHVCDKKFASQSSLTRHFRTIHKVNEHDYPSTGAARKVRLICPNESCDEEVLFYDSLHQHLAEEHGIEVECESLTFSSIKEFEIWKDEIQQRTFSLYTKDTGCKQLKSGIKRIYFNCHRSYSYTSKGNNIRATKSMGTNKIGRACPSRLAVTINEKTSDVNEPVVSVKYWKTHCGHSLEIRRISLNKDIRLKIAGKLREGVTFDRVLDNIRDSECDNDTYPRQQLLDRKDIHNIVRDFHINFTTKFHNNDAVSDKLWVQEKKRIQQSHKASKNIERKDITVVENQREWRVSSSSNSEQQYQIIKAQETCDISCLMCKDCNICIHTYICSCVDNLIKMNICKHIHAVSREFSMIPVFDKEINNEIINSIEMNRSDGDCDLKNKQSLINKTELLLGLLNTVELSDENMISVEKQIDRAIDMLI